MSDRIELRGLRVVGTHGVLPEERERAQPFEVDIDADLDLGPAGRTDELTATLDYAAIVEAASRVVGGERHDLLERIAERIAEEVLGIGAREVTVAVRKLRPPVAADLASAGVRITR